jgi:hypothetical protein
MYHSYIKDIDSLIQHHVQGFQYFLSVPVLRYLVFLKSAV